MEQTAERISFDFLPGLPIVVETQPTLMSSDAGMIPIGQFDDQIGFTDRFVDGLHDPRDPALTDPRPEPRRNGFDEMVRQRVYGILAGYEDCNDHDALRSDPVFKLIGGRKPDEDPLASQPTLSRFENAVDIPSLWRLHDFFLDDFIASFDQPPTHITLDIDALDDPCHGAQQLVFFHGFYEQYQYLPLLITCAETQQVVWPTLRPGNVHGALGADANLRFMVTDRPGAGVVPEAAYDDYAERGESENRNKELKAELHGDRLSCHRFLANYFRLMLHAAALNLLVRLRRVVADPPTLTTSDDRSGDAVPVADPTVPVEALHGEERRRYHRYRRQRDPLGQGHITTWRMMLIKVACEVIQSTRRILLRLPAHWPFLPWFIRVCRGIDDLRRCVQVVSPAC